MDRSQYTFYESFYKAAKSIKSKSVRCDLYDMICRYALYGEEPDIEKLPDAVAMAYELIKPTLNASRRKAENGKRGGASKIVDSKPNQTQSKPKQTEANDKQGETASEKENEIEKEKENEIEIENECYIYRAPRLDPESKPKGIEQAAKPPRTRFIEPDVDSVREYCQEKGLSVDPERFVDYYTANGWHVGKSPMKDWKATVRNWARNSGSSAQSGTRELDDEEIAAIKRMMGDES